MGRQMAVKTFLNSLSILLFISLTVNCAYAELPQVVSTNPPNGVVGVRPDFDWIYIVFDKPMGWPNFDPMSKCFEVGDNWELTDILLAGDRIFHFVRNTYTPNLPLGATIELTLNPLGAGPNCFKDTEGNLLPYISIEFHHKAAARRARCLQTLTRDFTGLII